MPNYVLNAYRKIEDQVESNPDTFHRLDYKPLLIESRKQIAKFIGVKDHDEVVLVPNTSDGLNTVLRNFIWTKEDLIITCAWNACFIRCYCSDPLTFTAGTTTYDSISRTAQYINDIPPHPSTTQFNILFPDTWDNIIENWRQFLQDIKSVSTIFLCEAEAPF